MVDCSVVDATIKMASERCWLRMFRDNKANWEFAVQPAFTLRFGGATAVQCGNSPRLMSLGEPYSAGMG